MGWWIFLPLCSGSLAAFLAGAVAVRQPTRSMILAWFLGVLVVTLLLRQLPDMARKAFASGKLMRARALYRWVERLAVRPYAKLQAALSLIAVEIERGQITWAEQRLAASEAMASANPAARAIWLNSRAYLALRRKLPGAQALSDARWAWQQFPHVDGFAHTYGLACLEAGQLEEAVVVLESLMPQAGELALRAQRAWDLSRAWLAKGQTSYAMTYQLEARAAWGQGSSAPWYTGLGETSGRGRAG